MSLVGLNSADFLVDGERSWLLEINPGPGATLDIFEPSEASLFALHMAACAGELRRGTALSQRREGGRDRLCAKMISLRVPRPDWPDWTADRPLAGSAIKAGRAAVHGLCLRFDRGGGESAGGRTA